jgi:1-aminocyclopropane-1-carboxylate deaminase/D-cysteine desulfhydrase-like pyridoxal-dependent ACC family enzyme
VQRIAALSTPHCDLWVKRDDLTHEVYGGNKVRKLEGVLAQALASGAKRIVTVGAAGSHHVLATTYFGTRAGLEVEAVLVSQPRTEHVVEVLRAEVGLGLHAFPVSLWAVAPLVFAIRVLSGARPIAAGGSSVCGSMGYVRAAREFANQVRQGLVPEPDVCVVPLGSGGTVAGLAAGFEVEKLKTRVVGVCVLRPAWLLRLGVNRLARACAKRTGLALPSLTKTRITFDDRFIGKGYGRSVPIADEAAREASEAAGLSLDPTYTAKAFAAALWHVRARRAPCVLYWHTLSSAPMAGLLRGSPPEFSLAAPLRKLLR